MKKQFTPDEVRNNKGCYSLEDVNKLSFIKKDNIDILDILKSEISIKDKCWFLRNSCNLTLDERKELAYVCAKSVLVIFQNKYPDDNRVKLCIEGILDFKNGKISKDDLYKLRQDCWESRKITYAADAADAAAAYAADAAAADADAADAAYAADADAYAYAYAYAAAYAADADAYAYAYAAAYAADADAADADAADADADAADADAAYAYAYAAAYAADAAAAYASNKLFTQLKNKVQGKKSYKELLLNDIINFIKSIK